MEFLGVLLLFSFTFRRFGIHLCRSIIRHYVYVYSTFPYKAEDAKKLSQREGNKKTTVIHQKDKLLMTLKVYTNTRRLKDDACDVYSRGLLINETQQQRKNHTLTFLPPCCVFMMRGQESFLINASFDLIGCDMEDV